MTTVSKRMNRHKLNKSGLTLRAGEFEPNSLNDDLFLIVGWNPLTPLPYGYESIEKFFPFVSYRQYSDRTMFITPDRVAFHHSFVIAKPINLLQGSIFFIPL